MRSLALRLRVMFEPSTLRFLSRLMQAHQPVEKVGVGDERRAQDFQNLEKNFPFLDILKMIDGIFILNLQEEIPFNECNQSFFSCFKP
jgi:hypothetical protein